VSQNGGPVLEISQVGKTYDAGAKATRRSRRVLHGRRPRVRLVVGPSGCGKTTLLKCVGGLLRPSSARCSSAERVTASEEMGFVFQEYGRSLMPWLTVRKNVLLPLRPSLRPS
jgi:NitT/TauT family transport system ATP-binding protein